MGHTATVSKLEDLDQVFQQALREEGLGFIGAKIEETEYLPASPKEPEINVYRFRNSFRKPG